MVAVLLPIIPFIHWRLVIYFAQYRAVHNSIFLQRFVAEICKLGFGCLSSSVLRSGCCQQEIVVHLALWKRCTFTHKIVRVLQRFMTRA